MTRVERDTLEYLASEQRKAENAYARTGQAWYAEEAESLSRRYDVAERLYSRYACHSVPHDQNKSFF